MARHRRKLIVQQWVTVDNVAAEEDGGLGFVSGEPFSDTDSSPFRTNLMRTLPRHGASRALVDDIRRFFHGLR